LFQGGVLSLSFSDFLCFFFGLPLFLPFVVFAVFPSSRYPFELFFGFWSSNCASGDLGSEIQTLCLCAVNVFIKGEIEKPIGPWFDL
jgi:hypothetical protein